MFKMNTALNDHVITLRKAKQTWRKGGGGKEKERGLSLIF